MAQDDEGVQQGAVGQVCLTEHRGRTVVQKRFTDRFRQEVEILALRHLADQAFPVPEIVGVGAESIFMTLMPGERLDSGSADLRLARLRASTTWLRRLHETPPPGQLPPAPDDALIIRRYRDAGGPRLPLVIPQAGPPSFCHGDWTDGNLLAVGPDITGIIDWEAAHLGDPLRELSRAAWGASLKDVRSIDAL
ncbi:MAG: phosphotransferase, partial [Propionibacteriaceae bacterium]